jgi:tetraacyldisaccharide 4'-kinase
MGWINCNSTHFFCRIFLFFWILGAIFNPYKNNRMRWYLIPISILFRLIVVIRNVLFNVGILESKKYNFPIISIGNITVGGTGKTPHSEYLIRMLHDNYSLAVLSRGYKRKTTGFREVNEDSSVLQVGDEPLQIKRKFPKIRVIVDEKRVHAIDKLVSEPNAPEIIILDDAFQHRYVNAGLKILLMDYNRPIYNDIMLPAGTLREPASGISRADIVVVTKCPNQIGKAEFEFFYKKLKIKKPQVLFLTKVIYDGIHKVFENSSIQYNLHLKDVSALVVTGIANPLPFQQKVSETVAGMEILAFPDHHSFNEGECKLIVDRFLALSGKNKCIITTEKDAMRFRSPEIDYFFQDLPIYYYPISIEFLLDGEQVFKKRVEEYIATH